MKNLEQGNNISTIEQVPFSEVGQLWSAYLNNRPIMSISIAIPPYPVITL